MNEEVLKEMEKYAEENSVPIMQKKGINFLCKFIEKNEIKTILELGTAIGYSSIKMALTNEDIQIVSIERDQERYIEALKNIKKPTIIMLASVKTPIKLVIYKLPKQWKMHKKTA